MAAMTPARSAISPPVTAYRVLRTLTEPKYSASKYNVVSAQPLNILEIFPTNESGPNVLETSIIIERAPCPLNGFKSATGRAGTKSVFKPTAARHQAMACSMYVKKPAICSPIITMAVDFIEMTTMKSW